MLYRLLCLLRNLYDLVLYYYTVNYVNSFLNFNRSALDRRFYTESDRLHRNLQLNSQQHECGIAGVTPADMKADRNRGCALKWFKSYLSPRSSVLFEFT